MLDDFEQLLAQEHARRGWRGQLAAWRRALADLVRSSVRERASQHRSASPHLPHHGGERVSSLLSDFRYAVRGLRRARGFAAAAVLTLALGIGANTSIFALIQSVLLRPLPYHEPDRLVRIYQLAIEHDEPRNWVSPAFFKDMEDQNETLATMAAWYVSAATVSGPEGEAEFQYSGAVTPRFFDVLGVTPLMGRTFRMADAEPGNRRVILGEDYWRVRFGAAPDIVGRTMTRNRVEYEIIGVVPASVDLPREAMMWTAIPDSPERWENRGSHYLQVIGRLAPGATLEAARSNLEAIALRAVEDHPSSHVGWGVSVYGLHEDLAHEIRPALLLMQAAGLVVLLIACVNVANLQLARSNARTGEFALRTALGARRSRIAQQVLAESMVLAGIGAAGGLAVALAVVRSLRAVAPAAILDVDAVRIDPVVLVFTAIVAIGTSLLVGISPALRSSSSSGRAVLRDGAHRVTGGGRRFREALVTAEVALSLVLLAGAALLVNSFFHLVSVDPGIDGEDILTARVSIPASVYSEPLDRARFFRELHRAAERIPRVESASLVSDLPLTGGVAYWGNGFRRLDLPPPPPGRGPVAMLRWISPGHLETVGLPLIRGRSFTYADTEAAPHVVLIDQTMADRFFPGEDAIGKRLLILYNDWEAEIIGIVGNAKQASLDEPLEPHMYVSYWQTYEPMFLSSMVVTLRTAAPPAQTVASLRAAVSALDPLVVPTDIETFEARIAGSVAPQRFSMLLVTVFAVMAAFLAAVGIYGVIAYLVSQRTREIGIRVALGAQQRNVLSLILRRGLTITMIGVGLGLIGLFATHEVLAQFLYEVSATDPVTIVVVALLLVTVATAATLLPARRAAKLDPLMALRAEG